jgi:predicted transcriptional regulator
MANLSIELPDDLARRLEGIASVQHKSVQQLAVDQLTSLAEAVAPGSPAALLRAVLSPPYVSSEDVDELEAAIASGRLPVRASDPFSSDLS